MTGKRPGHRMLGAQLRIPFQAINARIAEDLAAAGFPDLRPAHFSVFQHLDPDGSRASDLADRAQMTKQSMGELVAYLEQQGYLERLPDPNDRRARIVRRTERGLAVERTARASIQRLDEEWTRRLGPERMGLFRELLTDLVAVVEAPATGAPLGGTAEPDEAGRTGNGAAQ